MEWQPPIGEVYADAERYEQIGIVFDRWLLSSDE